VRIGISRWAMDFSFFAHLIVDDNLGEAPRVKGV
jgi:hypothetical protein